jgi:hypothetical protein
MNTSWPFVIIRHGTAICEHPEVFDQILNIAHSHPGSCDEIWICAKSFASRACLLRTLPPLANHLREECDRHGILLSFQQPVTLGHRPIPNFLQSDPDLYSFTADDLNCDENGERIPGQLCPRSENVLRFAYEYAKTILEILKPSSYWLDDDLRVGESKPQGCFCPRCLEAFNRQHGTSLTREELAKRLFDENVTIDPLRGQWANFNTESIARYAAETRRAADDLHSDCRLAIQTIWANRFYSATSYRPLLEVLSGEERRPVGIRPGALFFNEYNPRGMTHKSLNVAREAERCHRYGFVGSVCYEQETYPQKVLHKSPETIMVESTLALASGCDSLSEYYYNYANHEPLDYYDDFSRELSHWRPYLKLVAAPNRRTSLAGLARFLGANAFNHASFTLNDKTDEWLAEAGIPITVEEAGPNAFLVTAKTVECLTAEDFPRLFASPTLLPADAFDSLAEKYPAELGKFAPEASLARASLAEAVRAGCLAVVESGKVIMPDQPISDEIVADALQYGAVIGTTALGAKFAIVETLLQFPTAFRRRAILDALDAITNHGFPVRLEPCQAVRVLPRTDKDGKIEAVTLLNLSIGRTRELTLQVRHPASRTPRLAQPASEPVPIPSRYDADRDCLTITVPRLAAWKPATICL